VRHALPYKWKNVSVRKLLEEQTGFPVCIENNVRMMAMGEIVFSGCRNRASGITGNFLYVFVGEGIACAIVYNNELIRGNVFGAGELGHTVVSWDGPECRCGKRGCLEVIASEYAIKKQVAEALAGNSPLGSSTKSLKELVKDPASPTIGEIFKAWDRGDETVKAILNEAVKYLGGSIANVINLINPRLVLIDAQIFSHPDLKVRLLETSKEHVFALTDSDTEYEFIDNDIYKCSIGCAACAVQHFLVKHF
jgi:predicted NBD/HSP70 family sugar kinase